MGLVDGLTHFEIVEINSARKKANLTVTELVDLLEDDEYVPAKLKARVAYLEAKLAKLNKIIQED